MLQAGDNDARHHRSCLQEGQCTLPGSCKPSGAAIVAQLLRYELILNFNWYRTNCWCSLMWIGCFLIACKFFCEIKLNMQNVTSWGSSCMPRWRWQMWPARCSKRDSVPGKLGRAWPCLVRLDDEVLMLNESQAERLPLFFWRIDLQMDYNSGNSQLALVNATVGFMEAVLLHLHHEMKHQICLHAWHMPKNSPRILPSTQDDPNCLWCRQQ